MTYPEIPPFGDIMKTIIATIIVSAILGGNILITESEAPPSTFQLSRHQIIVKQAMVYGAQAEELSNVAKCESGYSMKVIGQAGEIGAWQYNPDTFRRMSKAMGEKLNIDSFDDQAKLTAWVYANHPEWKDQWSTWRVWYGEGLKKCRH